MALTVTTLAAMLRLTDGTEAPPEPLNTILTLRLETAVELVENYSPSAPDSVKDSATALIASYLHDTPPGDGTRFANSISNSGAAAILARYVSHAIAIVDGSGTPIISIPAGDGTDLDAAHVSELLHALVAAWAFVADDTKIPIEKLPDSIGGSTEIGANAAMSGQVGQWRQSGITIPAGDFYIELAYANVWQTQQRVNRTRLAALGNVVVGQGSGGYIQMADVDNQNFYISHDSNDNIVVASSPGAATMGMRVST